MGAHRAGPCELGEYSTHSGSLHISIDLRNEVISYLGFILRFNFLRLFPGIYVFITIMNGTFYFPGYFLAGYFQYIKRD